MCDSLSRRAVIRLLRSSSLHPHAVYYLSSASSTFSVGVNGACHQRRSILTAPPSQLPRGTEKFSVAALPAVEKEDDGEDPLEFNASLVPAAAADSPASPLPSHHCSPPPSSSSAALQSLPLHSILNKRNHTTRWRCGDCAEVNSLQALYCRHCQKERYQLLVCCPTCRSVHQMSNEEVCGKANSFPASSEGAAAAAAGVSSVFGPENCFSPLAASIRCETCEDLLHGGGVIANNRSGGWWCACGVVSPALACSCLRCRLPRWLPAQQRADVILKYWDRKSSSHWWCESCSSINSASVKVVGLRSINASGAAGSRSPAEKQAKLRRGRAHCQCCGEPWHFSQGSLDVTSAPKGEEEERRWLDSSSHQQQQLPRCWRCACHAVNRGYALHCMSCSLPARPLTVDAISSWCKGDWICSQCGRHHYRERVSCLCGGGKETN